MNAEERERIAQEVIDTRSTWPAVYDGVAAVAITEALRLAIPDDSVVVKRKEVQILDWAFDQLHAPSRMIIGQNEEYYDKYAEALSTLRRLADALGDA